MLDEIREIRTVDVILPTRDGHEIRQRCIARPTEHQAILLHKRGLTMPRNLERTDM